MSEENNENKSKSDSTFALNFVDHHLLLDINFNGHSLIKHNISIPNKVINLYISYILNPQFKAKALKLTKNPNLDKYKCSGYSIEFYSRSEF